MVYERSDERHARAVVVECAYIGGRRNGASGRYVPNARTLQTCRLAELIRVLAVWIEVLEVVTRIGCQTGATLEKRNGEISDRLTWTSPRNALNSGDACSRGAFDCV